MTPSHFSGIWGGQATDGSSIRGAGPREAEAERQRRSEEEAERQRAGKKRRGKEPKPVSETPDDKAQSNFTDPEAKIMPQSNKGWDYSGNAQASVDSKHQIIVVCFEIGRAHV